MRVELLFWAGCPSHETALRELRAALAQEGADADAVDVREVMTEADAVGGGFVGSPTIRIDGIDVQPEPNEPLGLTCRVYKRRDGRFSPTPDPADLRDAIRRARARAGAGAR
jgi:predicted Zn-dependent protease